MSSNERDGSTQRAPRHDLRRTFMMTRAAGGARSARKPCGGFVRRANETKEPRMRIGYLIDVNKGPYDQPMPPPDDVHRTLEQMIEEGIVAEKSGFHSLQVPAPPRAHGVLLPRARAAAHDPRARDRQGRDRHVHVRRDALPPVARRRAVRDHRQPLQGAPLHDDVARLPPGLLGPVRHPAGEAARPLPREHQDLEGGVQGRAVRLRRQALAGRSRASSRPAPTRRAAGRSGAAATRAPRRSAARRRTARR